MQNVVKLYGLPKCGKCEKAKEKLKMFNVEYEECDYKHFVTLHDGWRYDGSINVIAGKSFYGEHAVPLIEVDNKVFDYPRFMKELKATSKRQEATA